MKKTATKLTQNLNLKLETVRLITARPVTDEQLQQIVGGTVIGSGTYHTRTC